MDIQMKKVANDSVVLIEVLIIFAIGFVSGVHWAARTTLLELGVWARIHPLCNLNTLQFCIIVGGAIVVMVFLENHRRKCILASCAS